MLANRCVNIQQIEEKCERQELNLHGFPHWILSPARLPIPPLSQETHTILVCDIPSPSSSVVP